MRNSHDITDAYRRGNIGCVRIPPDRAIARGALALTAAALAAQLWLLYYRTFNVDEFEHVHAAWCTAKGLVPYRDFFEHHTPLLYLAAAPLFAAPEIAFDPDAAVRVLFDARLAMLTLTIGIVVLTYRLGVWWQDRLTGALATALLTSHEQFMKSALEFRPDVQAALLEVAALASAWLSRSPSAAAGAVWALGSGAAVALAVLSTQKAVFVAPGALLMVAASRRAASMAAFAAGGGITLLAVLVWFGDRASLAAFFHANVIVNAQLTMTDRFPALPQFLLSAIHHPALFVFGVAGIVHVWRRYSWRDPRAGIAAAAASFIVGAFVVGNPYAQYYALLSPTLAIPAAATMRRCFSRSLPSWANQRAARVAPWVAAVAGIVALITFVVPRTSLRGLVVIVSFSCMALLAAAAARLWGRRPVAAGMLALASLGTLMVGNTARAFHANDDELAELRWVTVHTRTSDTALSGFQRGPVFRPHAWFYFFLSGPFATERDYLELLATLEAGQVQPRLVVFNARLASAPQSLLAYIRANYRPVRGDLLERVGAAR
jgi:hypothetical protein